MPHDQRQTYGARLGKGLLEPLQIFEFNVTKSLWLVIPITDDFNRLRLLEPIQEQFNGGQIMTRTAWEQKSLQLGLC